MPDTGVDNRAVTLLDATLRDGSYAVNFQFEPTFAYFTDHARAVHVMTRSAFT
jgi:hypothetical protein